MSLSSGNRLGCSCRRTGYGLEPERAAARWWGEALEIDVALEQLGICSTKSERPSWLFSLGAGVVDETCEEDRKFGACEQVLVDEGLPEGQRTGVCNALKRETYEASELSINQMAGKCVDNG